MLTFATLCFIWSTDVIRKSLKEPNSSLNFPNPFTKVFCVSEKISSAFLKLNVDLNTFVWKSLNTALTLSSVSPSICLTRLINPSTFSLVSDNLLLKDKTNEENALLVAFIPAWTSGISLIVFSHACADLIAFSMADITKSTPLAISEFFSIH